MGRSRVVAVVLAGSLALAAAGAGCNALSGAGDLRVGPDDVVSGPEAPAPGLDAAEGSTSAPFDGGGAAADAGEAAVDASESGSRLKTVTFESGNITGPTGGDTAFGSPLLYTTNPLSGLRSLRTAQSTNGIEVDFAAQSELFTTVLVRFENIGFSVLSFLRFLPESGGSTAEITADDTLGELGLVVTPSAGPSQTGGDISGPGIYRIGVHLKHDQTVTSIEVFLANKGAAFGMPILKKTVPVLGRTTGVRLGALNGGSGPGPGARIVVDDLLVDTLAMPGP